MLIGYARVSTSDQDTDLQLRALKRAGVRRVFEERGSGATMARRPQLAQLLEQLREGDVVVVFKLDRFARSLRDLLLILDRIEHAGAGFRSVTEAIDTTTPAGRMMMQLLGAFAEFERSVIVERSRAGVAAARERGVRFGRPRALSPSEEARAVELVLSGQLTRSAAARRYGVDISSIRRAIARAETTTPARGRRRARAGEARP